MGVIHPCERLADWLLEVNHRQMNRAAIAESQPYYSRHPELHLLRGEREAFLNAFYSGLTSMADRETFTFWEHLHKISVHKTHEEAWALMQMRRMLWLEDDKELRLLAGIPENWLDPGEIVELKGVGSYFGKINFRVSRSEDGSAINLQWEPSFHTVPETVRVHLPGLSLLSTAHARLYTPGREWVEILDPAEPLTASLIFAEEYASRA